MEYTDYIKGKNVILTCPSSILKNKKLGNWIDNFDVVVRLNNFFNINNELDFGKRCDVLYINKIFNQQFEPFPIEEWKKRGLVFLCYKYGLKYKYDIISTRYFAKVANELINEITGILLGTLAIKDILNQKPNKLIVCGMDFYTNSDSYLDNYTKGRLSDSDNVYNPFINHNVESNKKYVLNLYKNNLIDFCNITKKILKLE